MMREKEPHTGKQSTAQNDKKENEHLSDSIADAHSSGDGALERGKDSLIASDDDGLATDVSGDDNEAY